MHVSCKDLAVAAVAVDAVIVGAAVDVAVVLAHVTTVCSVQNKIFPERSR